MNEHELQHEVSRLGRLHRHTDGRLGGWPKVLLLIDVTLGPDAIAAIHDIWQRAALPAGAVTTAATGAGRVTTGTHPPGGRGVESLPPRRAVPMCQGSIFRCVPE
ncbi:MAG: hypothetical protein NTW96_24720 [Planctomycetia bacterium]|nr:hypothetical protein [Planctomycetia bacterium]